MRKQTLVKLGLGLAALIVVPWLFLRTLQDTIAAPYEVPADALSSWTLVLADPMRPAVWAAGLQPPPCSVPRCSTSSSTGPWCR
ncbi:MAG: hypothetical protein OXG35_04670 [Acidobacteria bacterium]|nr:hypothetical protein [Acidobacteriota bacterium]